MRFRVAEPGLTTCFVCLLMGMPCFFASASLTDSFKLPSLSLVCIVRAIGSFTLLKFSFAVTSVAGPATIEAIVFLTGAAAVAGLRVEALAAAGI